MSLISTVHAENKAAENIKANENEVVIHSNHVNIKSPDASLGVKSPDTLLGAAPSALAEGKNISSSNNKKEDFYEVIKKLRGEEGIDVAFDSLGGATYSKANKLLGSGGRIVNYGVANQVGSGPDWWNTLKVMWQFGIFHPVLLTLNSKGMIGVNMLRIADNRPEALKRCIQSVADLTTNGELKPQVAAEFHVDQIADAHEFLEGRKTMGKIVVKW